MKKILYILMVLFVSAAVCKNSDSENLLPYLNKSLSAETRAEDLLSRMTLEEKIGQMAQVDSRGLVAEDIEKYKLGSILSGGGSMPSDISAAGWNAHCDSLQSFALKTRLAIPLIYGIDSIHGANKTSGSVIFPHHIALGAANNPELMEKIGRITAIETRASGVRWAFSPCIAVSLDGRWGRRYESFSEDEKIVSALGAAEIRGLQTGKNRISACAKHYLGDGGTENGKDQGNVKESERFIREKFLPPYIEAVKNDVDTIMVSYSSINGKKMHGSKYWITDVLKNELNFKGFVVTDWEALNQLKGNNKSQLEQGINAGIDMVMVPFNYKAFISDMTMLINENKISTNRIDDAVRRILYIKFKSGLFENPTADKELQKKVGSAEHRAVARQAVRESLVVLKNDAFFPLKKDLKKIVIAGERGADLGSQCGGWTIDWQGSVGKVTDGTDILTAVKKAVSKNTEVVFSKDGSNISGADAVIVVVGETPYAEYVGDKRDLSLGPIDSDLIKNVRKSGIPYGIILISGRPMTVDTEIHDSKAFIAAWLPGTEADGIADVIFGDFKPKGTLPFSWSVSSGKSGDGGLVFPLGYRLTW